MGEQTEAEIHLYAGGHTVAGNASWGRKPDVFTDIWRGIISLQRKEYTKRGDIQSGCPQKGKLHVTEKLMTITQFPLEHRSESQEAASLEAHAGSCVCCVLCVVGGVICPTLSFRES